MISVSYSFPTLDIIWKMLNSKLQYYKYQTEDYRAVIEILSGITTEKYYEFKYKLSFYPIGEGDIKPYIGEHEIKINKNYKG